MDNHNPSSVQAEGEERECNWEEAITLQKWFKQTELGIFSPPIYPPHNHARCWRTKALCDCTQYYTITTETKWCVKLLLHRSMCAQIFFFSNEFFLCVCVTSAVQLHRRTAAVPVRNERKNRHRDSCVTRREMCSPQTFINTAAYKENRIPL